MGFLKLLHRNHPPLERPVPATETENETGGKTSKGKSSSSNNRQNIKNGASASADGRIVEDDDAPPRLDWQLRRRPSTQLITLDLNGELTDTPWVDVARDADSSSPSSGSLGFSAALNAADGTSGKATERTVNPRLGQILDEYRLDVEQCTLLVKACSRVIAEQGLETLGLFRPWRAAESPYHITRALGIFVHIVNPDGPDIPLEGTDFLGLKQRSSQEDKLSSFYDILHDLGVHNVVACLKWGLRHVRYGSSGFGGGNGDAWSWYNDFVQEEKNQVYPPFAYASILLPNLSKEHAELLETALALIASVSAHAAQNAMTASHLCALVGFWLFGRQHIAFDNPEHLIKEHETASKALEHIFLAYLRTQTGLPSRLKELIQSYPPADTRDHTDSSSLHVTISLEKSQKFGGANQGRKKRTPLPPGTMLSNASLAVAEDGMLETAESKSWSSLQTDLIGPGQDGRTTNVRDEVVAEETARVFNLVADRAALLAKQKKVMLPRSYNGLAAAAPAPDLGNRRRSASLDAGVRGRTSPTGSVGDRAATDLSLPHPAGTDAGQTATRTSWSDFSNNGFSEGIDSDLFSLLTDFSASKHAAAEGGQAGSDKPNKLKKPYPFRYRFGGDGSPVSPAFEDAEFEILQLEEQDRPSQSQVRLLMVEQKYIDPVFAEVYLDALQEPVIRAAWPSFVIAELKTSTSHPYRSLMVEKRTHDSKLNTAVPSAPGASLPASLVNVKPVRPTSLATTATGDGGKRNKSFLGSMRSKNKRRMTEMFTRVGNSTSMTSLSLVRKSSRNSAVIPSDGESTAQEIIHEDGSAVDEMGRLPAVAKDLSKTKTTTYVEPQITGSARQGRSTPPAGLAVSVPTTSLQAGNDLPKPVERPPLPIIIKTSPMSPPRYFPPSPEKAAQTEPNASDTGQTTEPPQESRPDGPQRKLSRKPVPSDEDMPPGDEHDVFTEIKDIEEGAVPTEQQPTIAIVTESTHDEALAVEPQVSVDEQQDAPIAIHKAVATADEQEEEGAGTALTRKLRAEIAERAAKTQQYFAQSPDLAGNELVASADADQLVEPAVVDHQTTQKTDNPPMSVEEIIAASQTRAHMQDPSHDQSSHNSNVQRQSEGSSDTSPDQNGYGDVVTSDDRGVTAVQPDEVRPPREESLEPEMSEIGSSTSPVPSAIFVPAQREPVLAATADAEPAIVSTEVLPSEEEIIDSLVETSISNNDDAHSAVFPPEPMQQDEEPPIPAKNVDIADRPAALSSVENVHVMDPSIGQTVPLLDAVDSAFPDEEVIEHVRSKTPSLRDQLDEDIRRAAGARKRPSIESQTLPISPEMAERSLPSPVPAASDETPVKPIARSIEARSPSFSNTAAPILAIGSQQRRRESLSQASQASPTSPAADKRRFGDTFNRVSPSLKARLAGPFSKSSEKLDPASPVSTKGDARSPSVSEQGQSDLPPIPASPEMKTKKGSAAPGSPSSPSKAGKFMSGAKKMLGRKKSNIKAPEMEADKEKTASPPLPSMSVWPTVSPTAAAQAESPTGATAEIADDSQTTHAPSPLAEVPVRPPSPAIAEQLLSKEQATASQQAPEASLAPDASVEPAYADAGLSSQPQLDTERPVTAANAHVEVSSSASTAGEHPPHLPASVGAGEQPERPSIGVESKRISASGIAEIEDAIAAGDQAGNEKPKDPDVQDAMAQIHHEMNAAPAQSGQAAPTGVTTSSRNESDVTTTVEPAGPVVLDALDADLTEAEEPILREESDAVPLHDTMSEHAAPGEETSTQTTQSTSDPPHNLVADAPKREQHYLPGGMMPIETPLSEANTPFAEKASAV